MSLVQHDIELKYGLALREYLEHPGEELLLQAYDLGRAALASGMGVVDVAGIHNRSLMALLRGASLNSLGEDPLGTAEAFLMEILAPFEMVHRGYSEANSSLRRLNEVLEQEVRRIAQSLHDDAEQLLASLYLDVAEVERDVPAAYRHLQRMHGHLDQLRSDLRRLAHELRPTLLDDMGVLPALRSLADSVAKRTGLQVSVHGELDQRIHRAGETALYRIAQEALNNVVRHAQARRVEIRLQSHGRGVNCVIEDDGIGFDVAAVQGRTGERGLGLTGMQERLASVDGTLQIRSTPGRGTELLISIPLA